MSKQWITLLIIGFFVLGIAFAWDIYATANNLKGDFTFVYIPIDNSLYQKVQPHFAGSSSFADFQLQAAGIDSIDSFK